MSSLIRPKIELERDFMPVLVTCNFDDDSIKNERASMETAFSHYKSMGFLQTLKGSYLHSQWSDLAEIRTRPRFYACPRYLQVKKKDRIKSNREKLETPFSPFLVNGGFVSPWKSEFEPICLKILRNLSLTPNNAYAAFPPPPMMLQVALETFKFKCRKVSSLKGK